MTLPNQDIIGPQARVVGSNYTTFVWQSQPIAYLEVVQDSGQQAFGGQGGYDVIHPLGYWHPAEVATSRVVSAGQLVLTIREMWRRQIWEQLPGMTGTNNIIEVFQRLASSATPVSCTSIIKAPDGFTRGRVYHNVTIVNIQDGETIEVGTLTVPKTLTCVYTHTTPLGAST